MAEAAAGAGNSAITPEEGANLLMKAGLVDDIQDADASDAPDKETADEESDDDSLLGEESEAGEEGEGEGEGEVEEEDDEEEAPAKGKPAALDPTTPVFTLEIEGKQVPITVKEAKEGYLRVQDYTRKTMALAEERKQGEALRAAYQDRIEKYDAFLKSLEEPEPDWAKLRAEDPDGYLLKKDEFVTRKQEQEKVAAEKARLAKETEEKTTRELQEARAKFVDEQLAKLHEKLPKWKDPAIATREGKAIAKGLQEQYGFTSEELKDLVDHRLVLLVRDALLFHESKKRALPKITPPTVKPARPAAATNGQPQIGKRRQMRETMQRLSRSGSEEDAAAAMLAAGLI